MRSLLAACCAAVVLSGCSSSSAAKQTVTQTVVASPTSASKAAPSSSSAQPSVPTSTSSAGSAAGSDLSALVKRALAVKGAGLSGCDKDYMVTITGSHTMYCAGTPDNASVMFATTPTQSQMDSVAAANQGGWSINGPGWMIVSPDDRALRHFLKAFPEGMLM